jgi:hypothetical protein
MTLRRRLPRGRMVHGRLPTGRCPDGRVLAMAALLAITALTGFGRDAAGQTIRVSGSTSVRYVEIRAMMRDSVAATDAAGDGLMRQLPDGRVVRCVPQEEFCRDIRPGAIVSAVPVIQDLDVTAWGLGRGIHAFAQLRARSDWGGDALVWPRSDDRLEVLAAYVELERDRYRLRGGRQWKVSGAGFFNFDGVSLAVAPTTSSSVELYGGRSLVRGLNEGRSSGALEAIEALAPPEDGILAGIQGRYRLATRASLGASYHVDFRQDRRTLYSEIAAAQGIVRIGAGSVEASIDADVATRAINEARLHLRSPPLGRVVMFGELRRHRPRFELWTIWGAFSPLGFSESIGGATWAHPSGRLIARGELSYREYDEEGRSETLDDFRYVGRGATSAVTWMPRREWRLESSYRVESGFGAARRDASVAVTRRIGEATTVGISGVLFQRLYEFRIDEGKVAGLAAEASLPVAGRGRIFLHAASYRHLQAGERSGFDWNQRRASLRFQWVVGGEPEIEPPSAEVVR